MMDTILFGLTIGAILYLISIGLSLTFGTMKVINYAHGLVYALGVYFYISLLPRLGSFLPAMIVSVALVIPISYLIERLVVRRLYGQSIDYAIIATYAVLLMGTDAIKIVYGAIPYPLSVPVRGSFSFLGASLPIYRTLVVVAAVLVYLGITLFFKKSMVGKVVTAALDDLEGVRCLGLKVEKYFSIIFMIGSGLAALGGILYAPISSAHPYMGFHILLMAFAVVIVGGMGNMNGTFIAAFTLGLLISFTGRVYPQAAEVMVFVAMAIVLLFRPIEDSSH
ncbi:MAG: branched-chain amino acid ABC transporter permease [Bacillota bacterium]|nr:branched-chain amino acid ABC transporter permease [Bacillota bacterium]MDW7678014.1 branched-chain amino acid ABC transporter permease [Bacillota bacterium]